LSHSHRTLYIITKGREPPLLQITNYRIGLGAVIGYIYFMYKCILRSGDLGLLMLATSFSAQANVLDLEHKLYPALTSSERSSRISEQEKRVLLKTRADDACRKEMESPIWYAQSWKLAKTKIPISVGAKSRSFPETICLRRNPMKSFLRLNVKPSYPKTWSQGS